MSRPSGFLGVNLFEGGGGRQAGKAAFRLLLWAALARSLGMDESGSGTCRPRATAAARPARRPHMKRPLLVAALAAAWPAVAAATTTFESATTYCWQVDSSIYTNAVGSSVAVSSASDAECALALALDFPTTAVYAYDSVEVSWNASLREDANGSLAENAFGVSELYTGLDRISQKYYEVVYSRLQSCVVGADCDPVLVLTQQAANTSNQVGNFSGGSVTFSSNELVFSAPGNYTLLAHLILPGEVPTSQRYDYAVFSTVEILSRSTETTTSEPYAESSTSSSSTASGVSTEVVCVLIISGIVAVAMFAIGFTTLRSKTKPGDDDPAVASGKTKRRGQPFDRPNDQPTPVAEGDATPGRDENEFAMLSIHEATMSRPRGTFLSALGRISSTNGTANAGRPSPIPFVGPQVRQSIKHRPGYGGAEIEIGGDRTPPSSISDTPTSGRGNYADLGPTPKLQPQLLPQTGPRRQQSNKIVFNDIREDEVDSSSDAHVPSAMLTASNLHLGATAVDLDLTRVSRRIKHAMSNDDDESWGSSREEKLTENDLLASKGPSLQLSDLGMARGMVRDSNFD